MSAGGFLTLIAGAVILFLAACGSCALFGPAPQQDGYQCESKQIFFVRWGDCEPVLGAG